MFNLVPFKKEHLAPMLGQRINSFLINWMDSGHAQVMENCEGSFSGIVNGEVAIVGGTVIHWAGRGYLWAVFNQNFKQNFVPVFRGIKKYLDDHPCARLEMAVPIYCFEGHRRAELLGFKVECEKAEKYLSNGADATLYARIK